MFIQLPKQLEDELKTLTVIISGGGTGGHVYPAVAISNALREDLDIERVIYVGCPNSIEEKVANENSLDFLPIQFSGMPRKFSFKFIKWLYRLNKSTIDCIGYLLYTKPDIVIGTGGYVSAPLLFAALILDCPYIIHEADTHPGLVNKIMAPWAKAVTVAFDKAKKVLDNKNIKVTGNPLRASIGEFDRDEARIFLELDPDKKTLLVLGGSQGAKKINDGLIEALPRLLENYDLQIVHQCGPKNYEEIKNNLSREILENPSYILRGYFDDLSVPYAAADFAISRAGSMTISELVASMLPAILIPYPYAAADHQRNNAKTLVDEGAALYLENDECTGENIVNYVDSILSKPDKLDYMRLACGRISKKTATEEIIEIIKEHSKPKIKQESKKILDE